MSTEIHDGIAVRVAFRFGEDPSVVYRASADATIVTLLEEIG